MQIYLRDCQENNGIIFTIFYDKNKFRAWCRNSLKVLWKFPASWLPFGLFWNGLPEIKCFGLFECWRKNIFWSLSYRNLGKTGNILWNSNFESCYFLNFTFFSFLRVWPVLKLLMAKFGLFYFLDLASLSCLTILAWEK